VDAGAVELGDAGVVAHHFEIRVAEELLEGEDVARVAEIVDGEGVPEFVRVGVGDVGTVADALDEAGQDVALHRARVVGRSDEEEEVGGAHGGDAGERYFQMALEVRRPK